MLNSLSLSCVRGGCVSLGFMSMGVQFYLKSFVKVFLGA